MKHGRILGARDRDTLVPGAMQATTLFERMRGLLGRPALQPHEGLLLSPCNSIHTVGMRYPIDVVFLASDWRIRKVITALAPLRLAWSPRSTMTLELAAGTAERLRLVPNLQLEWQDQ